MPPHRSSRSALRLIDANLNRALEGLRVCEDISRFRLDASRACRRIRAARHAVAAAVARLPLAPEELLQARESRGDVGRRAAARAEASIERLLLINFQRAKESLRVLEECARLFTPNRSREFQAIRFRLYDIERDTLVAVVRHR